MATNPQEFSNPTPNQYGTEPIWEPASDCVHDNGMMAVVALDDAIRLLNEAATRLAAGSMAVWSIVDHARDHLEKQIEECMW